MKSKCLNKSNLLIALCWLAYSCSYLGKLSYNANINQIGEAFNASYADAGMVSTFFFFAYGAGQVVNGFLCKKYNVKYVIFASLMISSVLNVLIVSLPEFSIMKYLWLLNGATMSFLWTSIIRLISETLAKPAYMYINCMCIASAFIAPYLIHKLLTGKYFTRV